MAFRILSVAKAVPDNLVGSAEFDRKLGKSAGWLESECGVASRYVAAGQSQIDLGLSAAHAACEAAGVDAGDIDLVLSASGIGYQTLPSTAPLYQRGMGIADGRAAAFDVNSTCLSFLTALDIASALFEAGRYRRALVISSEIASRALPWDQDPAVAGLFSDGAAAAIVEADASARATFAFETYPSAWEACQIGAGGTRLDFHEDREAFIAHARFEMDGKALFRITSKHFRTFVEQLLDKAGWRVRDVDIVVPHQASPFALEHLVRQCGFAHEQVINIARTHGNQIAASIPIALSVASERGLLTKGAKVLMLGTSAGVSFGGLAMEV